jgi:quinol monooxygenase YgiN
MKFSRRNLCPFLAFAFLMTAGNLVPRASAQAEKNIYVVVHIDVIPPPAGLGPVNAMLKEFASDSRKDTGNIRFELLVQDGKPNHFVLLEVWQSRAAFDAHNGAEHTRRFREKIQPNLGSPFDERLNMLAP